MRRGHFVGRPVALAVAIVAACAGRAAADTYIRQPGVDALHYDFRLTLLTGDSDEVQGETTATFRLAAEGVHEIALDFSSPASDGRGMIVTAVTSAGRAVTYSHADNHLRLPVPAGSHAGQEIAFTIVYHGVPADGLRIVRNIHGDRTAFSENWHNQARRWLPTIDHPADKATGDFIITTASEYQVIANGRLVEQVDLGAGRRRTHWKQSAPISSWLYAIGIARFAVRYAGSVGGVPIEYWVFPQDAGPGFRLFDRDARNAFAFFSERIGPFAYDKLAHVEAAGMGGGIENASNIFYGEKSITAGNGPIVHETAHQWFGDAVTESDWNDVWLSEGFATYFALLYTEFAEGRDAFVAGVRRSRDAVLRLEKSLPDTPVVHRNLDEAATAPNNRLVYEKGGWTLHMLRDTVGTEPFWRAIREYYRRYRDATASTDDLRSIMEQESGSDLRWFFDQWLHRSGVPSIRGSWRYDAAAKQVVVTVQQTQPGDPYRFALGVGVSQAAGQPPRVDHVEVTRRDATFTLPADAEPVAVELDPDAWLLADFGAFARVRP